MYASILHAFPQKLCKLQHLKVNIMLSVIQVKLNKETTDTQSTGSRNVINAWQFQHM